MLPLDMEGAVHRGRLRSAQAYLEGQRPEWTQIMSKQVTTSLDVARFLRISLAHDVRCGREVVGNWR